MPRQHNQGGMLARRGARRLLSSTAGAGAAFSALAADGWQATVASPTDLSLTPVTVSRQGFDTTGATATISDTLYLTKRVRQAYPNNASFSANSVALSDYILSTDTVSGATNNSALTSPKPVADWLMPARQTVGNTLHWEIAAFHYFGRLGKQVACVRVRATDGTNFTSWQTVTAPTISSYVEDAVPLGLYQGDLDVSTLNNPARIWLEAEVYPWVGTSASVLKSEDVYAASGGKRAFTRRVYRRDTARAATFHRVYVASTGNDTSGVASTTDATAAASPCLTLHGAIVKLRAAAGATTGALDGARIFIVDSVSGGTATFNTYHQDVGAIIVTRASGTTRANAIVTTSAIIRPYFSDASATEDEGCLIFTDMTFKFGAATHAFTGETRKLHVQFWNCNIDFGSFAGAWRSNSHLSYFGAVFSNAVAANLSYTVAGELRILRGLTGTLGGGTEGWATYGCSLTACSGFTFADYTKGARTFCNKFLNPSAGNAVYNGDPALNTDTVVGAVFMQNLVETTHTTSSTAALGLFQGKGQSTHTIFCHNTFTGFGQLGRQNVFYSGFGLAANQVHTFARVVGNIISQPNVKNDVFSANAAFTGNWAYTHGVGVQGDFWQFAPNATSEGPDYGGMGTVTAPLVTTRNDPLFTNYQGTTGTATPTYVAGAGGGTYTLQSGSPAKNIVSSSILAFDLAGNARGVGTQHAGAYA